MISKKLPPVARAVVAEEAVITLSVEDQRRLASALLDPARPNAALKDAFRAYDEANVTTPQ